MNLQNARELKIPNLNNKLACDFFFQIHFAPNPGIIREAHFENVFFIIKEKERIHVQLADFYRVPFYRLSSMDTYLAEGVDANSFREGWLKKHPSTKGDTQMAVYCYRRVKITADFAQQPAETVLSSTP